LSPESNSKDHLFKKADYDGAPAESETACPGSLRLTDRLAVTGTSMKIESGSLFEKLPENLHQEVFETLLASGNLRVERIVSRGHASPEGFWYDQSRGEWVTVLKGAAVVEVEGGGEFRLEPGGYLNLPARTRHRVAWTAPDTETIWLAVHY